MKKIVLFNSPIEFLGKKGEDTIYGFVQDDDTYLTKENARRYIIYLMTASELYKDNYDSEDGVEFVRSADEKIWKNDAKWKAYKRKVDTEPISFEILDEDVADICDDDLSEVFLTNKEKWFKIKEKEGLGRVVIPTIVFRTPIPTGNDEFKIQGLLLDRRNRAPYLTKSEKLRLMYLSATRDWVKSGGVMDTGDYDGYWKKDGIGCLIDDNYVFQFVEQHYKGSQVSLIPVEYGMEWMGCAGLNSDILANPDFGMEIRDWVEQNGEWIDIEKMVNARVDVQIENKPIVKIHFED